MAEGALPPEPASPGKGAAGRCFGHGEIIIMENQPAEDRSGLSRGRELYRSGRYDEAAGCFRECRGADAAEAMFFLGSMILDHNVSPAAGEDGGELLKKSAELGFLPARYRSGGFFAGASAPAPGGDGAAGETPEAEAPEAGADRGGPDRYYAGQGSAGAMYAHGMACLGRGGPDAGEGAFWLERAARQGHPLAQYELGRLCLREKGAARDELSAVLWLGRAMDRGVYGAYCSLAGVYTDKKSRFYAPREGVKLLDRVKELCPEAYMMLARIYLRGEIVERDMDKARDYLGRARAAGVPESYVEIARLLMNERKPLEALPLLRHAAERGDGEAVYLLGVIYEKLSAADQPADPAEAGERKEEPAPDGEAAGPEGSPEDLARKALDLYREAAELGHAEAQYTLGGIYAREGDADAAGEWYRKAAEQEHAGAMYEYGCLLKKRADEEAAGRAPEAAGAPAAGGAPAAAAPENGGEPKENGGDPKYREAFEYLMKASLGGDSRAQYMVSQMYASGEGTKQDFAKSADWSEKAANRGNMEARMHMAEIYDKGNVPAVNLQKSAEWYRQASESGNEAASYRLGKMYSEGRGVEKDPKKAYRLYARAAESGYLPALEDLASCYMNGTGCDKNEKLAEKHLLKAAALGSGRAVDLLASLYLSPDSAVYSIAKALEFLKKGVGLGHSRSMLVLSRLYLQEDGPARDPEAGLGLLKKLADGGSREALYELGMIYLEGKFAERDFRKALTHFKASADKNYLKSLYMMGVCCYKGIGIVSKPWEALEYFRKAGELGYQKAYYALGRMYEKGIGCACDPDEAAHYYRILVNDNCGRAYLLLANMYLREDSNSRINYDEAEKWLYIGAKKNIPECAYRLGILHIEEKLRNSSAEYGLKLVNEAADRGYPEALYYLACMYIDGKYYRNDYGRALGYLQRAAEKYHLKSATKLGILYRYGLGCEINYSRAAELLLTAAKCGDCAAQLELAKMYRDGLGVGKSVVDAYVWTLVCLSLDSAFREAANFKVSLLSLMNPRDLKNSQAMAVKYLAMLGDAGAEDDVLMDL